MGAAGYKARNRIYRAMEEYTLALADFNRAIELEPKWAVLFHDCGHIYYKMEEYTLTLADYNGLKNSDRKNNTFKVDWKHEKTISTYLQSKNRS